MAYAHDKPTEIHVAVQRKASNVGFLLRWTPGNTKGGPWKELIAMRSNFAIAKAKTILKVSKNGKPLNTKTAKVKFGKKGALLLFFTTSVERGDRLTLSLPAFANVTTHALDKLSCDNCNRRPAKSKTPYRFSVP